MRVPSICLHAGLTCLVAAALAPRADAQSALSGEAIHIGRAAGRIDIDGDLSDEGWRGATRVDKWYEINPGDNTEPKVKNVAFLAYDDRFLYAGFEFDDPNPETIRAPLGDRDNVPGFTDYGGMIVGARNDGRSAQMFLANARGIQYDAITDDASGEDSSPDFFWESAARITARGWTLEMRVPFSSLRYHNVDPQTWGIMLYRNYPRDFHYQFFSTKVPRGGNCFVCRSNTLVGLEHLPSGGHIVAAPYVTASESAAPAGDLGTPLVDAPVKPHAGIDVKYTPNADTAVDVTVKPDFSQVESDTAQISANERFALFFQEKRPFFLEGSNLLSTPFSAVYTRTITAPRWGGRVTGKEGGVTFTALVADDAGGGSVVIPGANGSDTAPQDFSSRVFVARARKEIGRSFISALVTDRETDGFGHNRVFGPDFEWHPNVADTLVGQLLFSDTLTPNRLDLYSGWNGQTLDSHAGVVRWTHNTTHLDLTGTYNDVGAGFRADTGFIPQVDFRETYGEGGYTIYPHGFLSRLRMFLITDRQVQTDGRTITHQVSPGAGMDTKLNGFMRFRYENDVVRSGDLLIPRQQFVYTVLVSPSRAISQVSIDGFVGQEVDFANSRPGRGATINVNATLHPGGHLELALLQAERILNVDDPAGAGKRLFNAQVSRVRGTYTFTARSFARIIAQYVATHRDPSLYLAETPATSGTFSGSALLAYKLNWQSVLFVGYGDDRELSDLNRFEKADRQFFVKISYAFQR
jgi:hypothetical protein